jgi:hypothetical protein
MITLGVVLEYLAAIGVWLGWWAMGWPDLTGTKWESASATRFGTNIIGRTSSTGQSTALPPRSRSG